MAQIPIYKPWDVERLAAEFLAQYWLPSETWVDIELIIESDLDVRIDYAFLDSKRVIGLIGVREDGGFTIVVDEKLADEQPLVYRSTLAQEVGHLVLHKDLLAVRTFEQASVLHGALSEAQYTEIERDANIFALAVLMPTNCFIDAAMSLYSDWFARIIAKVHRVDADYLLGKITEELAKRFQVTLKAVGMRLLSLKLQPAILDSAHKAIPNINL